MGPIKIFIMTGEASGELHGAMLVNRLKKLSRDLEFSGVGGNKLEAEGVSLVYNYSEFSSMGVVEPLLKLRFYARALKNISNYIFSNNIKTAILVDYPGFNLQLAKRLKKQGVRVIYYISPQIWAWHYSRIKKIKRYVDEIIVFYPFEQEMYKKEGVKSIFAGNPLVDIVNEGLEASPDIGITAKSPCIALLPGSRPGEIKNLLGPMLQGAVLLGKRYNPTFLIAVLDGEARELVEKEVKAMFRQGLDIHVVVNNTYKAIQKSDIVVVSSGTATLETAILEKPMVVVYMVGLVSELLARILLKIDNISLVNIVAGKRICPELLQKHVNAQRICEEITGILDDRALYEKMSGEIRTVKKSLGEKGSIDRISKAVLDIIH